MPPARAPRRGGTPRPGNCRRYRVCEFGKRRHHAGTYADPPLSTKGWGTRKTEEKADHIVRDFVELRKLILLVTFAAGARRSARRDPLARDNNE